MTYDEHNELISELISIKILVQDANVSAGIDTAIAALDEYRDCLLELVSANASDDDDFRKKWVAHTAGVVLGVKVTP